MKDPVVTQSFLKSTLNKAFAEQDKKWDEKLDKKLDQLKQEIIKGVAEFVETSIIPTFDEHEKKLENHNSRIVNLEQRIPLIA